MSLKARWLATVLLLAEGVLLGSIVSQQLLERRHLETKQRAYQAESLSRFSRVAKDASIQRNELPVANYVRTLLESAVVRYAAVLDDEGLLRMHTALAAGAGAELIGRPWTGPRASADAATPAVASSEWEGREVDDWSLALVQGARRIGEVHIGFDRRALREQVRRDLAESRGRLTLVGAAMTVLALIVAFWLVRQLHAPLAALRQATLRVGGGDFQYRVPIPRPRELGELAEAFNRMASELERHGRFRDSLMASVSHDLRSPLTAIRSHAEFLLNDADATPEERREAAQLVYDNAGRMSAMTEDLTDLAKLQLGRIESVRKPTQVADAIRAVQNLMRVTADRLKVRLRAELPPVLPEVKADRGQIERILTNLIANALKFTPAEGEVLVRAEAQPHHLRVTVQDTGSGVPPEKLKTLFSKFVPSDGEEPDRTGLSTGLGLAICREMTEAHGGKIWAESEWGKGTRIHFTLPLQESPCSGEC